MIIRRAISIGFIIIAAAACARAGEREKVFLTGNDFSAWLDASQWSMAGDAYLHPRNENLLATREGTGVVTNGRGVKVPSLVSRREFGDVRAHIEFMIPKGSNSGVYFQGRYEIQIFDTFSDTNTTYVGNECGGIYPRWDETRLGKAYEGHSPKVNASKPPGQWQTFDCIFKAPRFDNSGKKIANACFIKVFHNGVLIHQNVEVTGPTRASYKDDESATGPLVLQGDHGPVAYRNVWVVPIDLDKMGLTNPFFAMDTGTIDESHKTAGAQAQMLKDLGYAGIGYWERNPAGGTTGLAEMLTALDSNTLKLFCEYFTIKLDEPNERNPALLNESINLLENKNAVLLLALSNSKLPKSSREGDDQAVAVIREIADTAHKAGICVALYPHSDAWLATINDAIRLTEKANRRNVGVTFNLYHWLKTEHSLRADIEQTIKKASPFLFVVTINGSSEAGSIETLDKGTFDVYNLLKILNSQGYTGPVGLQGTGLTGEASENLKRSIDAWRIFSQRLAADQAENL
jgi:sugar phosphate isomerase/epimerase